MLLSYLKIAWRNLLKNRQFTLLNLTGLTAGLTCTLLICLWVQDELAFDRFHETNARLYHVMENRPHAGGIRTSDETAALLAETLKGIMPEVAYAAAATPAFWFPKMALSTNDKVARAAVLFAGKDYFNIFSWPLLQGNRNDVLAERNGVVISEKLAAALFQTSKDIIGKTITWQADSTRRTAVVTGVFGALPANSSTQFDAVFAFAAFSEMMNMPGTMDSRNSWGPFHTYVVLHPDADTAKFNAGMNHMMTGLSDGTARHLFLKRYADNYLYGNYENGVQSGGRITYVKLFSLIAIIIILIACINFMNLSTAKAATRLKEMGIRKTAGASRSSLILQYLGESVLLAIIALCIALLATVLLLPIFNTITGKQLVLHTDLKLILLFLMIAIVTGLIAGSYPSFYLSRFKPVTVLKSALSHTGGAWVRKGLVIFQFTLSVIFIVAVLVVNRQIDYVQTRNPGYVKDHVIYFEADGKLQQHSDAFLAEVRKVPGVQQASGMAGNIVQGGPSSVGVRWEDGIIMFQPFLVNDDLIETLDIGMSSGHGFSGIFAADTSKIIFNEAAISAMGIKDPVGKVIVFGSRKREIAGVVKNFHFQSMHETVKPAYFQIEPQAGTLMVRLQAGQERSAIASIAALYSNWNPGYAFSSTFLDDEYQAQYLSEQRVAVLSKYFAALAVFISCMGLFGLAAYTGERRRKEIGVRKVLGATPGNLFLMLSRDFLHSVLIAVALGVPLAWWMLNNWLQGFAYHTQLGADVFLIAGGCLLLLTMLTISFQVMKAAVANPAVSLKAE